MVEGDNDKIGAGISNDQGTDKCHIVAFWLGLTVTIGLLCFPPPMF